MSDFISFAAYHGLLINQLAFGRIARCGTRSKPRSTNGAYLFNGEWGWAQDHASHESPVIWLSGSIENHAEAKQKIKESTQQYHQERSRLNADAAKKARWILSQCELNLSPYLGRKGFPEMCANIWATENSRLLVVPMYKDKSIVGCQLIDQEGNKKFLKGQATQDAYFQIGNGKLTFFVEGYVSGLSLQKVLEACKVSYKILVTFSAGNLLRFAKRIDGIVIADNDASKTGEKTAIDSGRKWWMPPVTGFDINDYCLEHGSFKPAMAVRKLIYSK